MNLLQHVTDYIANFLSKERALNKHVSYSVKKYRKTYKLLEEYDKKTGSSPKALADAGRLQPFIQKLQEKARNQ